MARGSAKASTAPRSLCGSVCFTAKLIVPASPCVSLPLTASRSICQSQHFTAPQAGIKWEGSWDEDVLEGEATIKLGANSGMLDAEFTGVGGDEVEVCAGRAHSQPADR